MNAWKRLKSPHPKIAQWVREGGLFVIVSNGITVLKFSSCRAVCGTSDGGFRLA